MGTGTHGRLRAGGHGPARTFTVSRLAPSSTTKSRRCPQGLLASSGASSAAASSPSPSPRGRLGAAILLLPPPRGTGHTSLGAPPPARPPAAPTTQDGAQDALVISLRRDPLPDGSVTVPEAGWGAGRGSGASCAGVSRRSALVEAASGVLPGGARGAARRGHGAEPEGPGGAAAGRAAGRWHRPQAAAGRRRPGLRRPRVRLHR